LIFSYKECAELISIPSGAIKSIADFEAEANPFKVFQFLLVRLRVLFRRACYGRKSISIPSGAIKSLLFFLQKCRGCQISIPSGAIKRRELWAEMIAEELISIPSGAIKRDDFINNYSQASYISIPSGAIKRMLDFWRVFFSLMRFQFLLVRLREEHRPAA